MKHLDKNIFNTFFLTAIGTSDISEKVLNFLKQEKINTDLVSKIASKAAVREKLTAQQKFIGLKGGIVAEGRYIGSTVFPDAELKVFLTASSGERARRRANDLINQGFSVPNLQELEKEIQERDKIDSTREIAPLVKAKDAKENPKKDSAMFRRKLDDKIKKELIYLQLLQENKK